MKTFEDICKMTQMQVKAYMKDYLTSKKYSVINEDGFLYAKGDVPVLLVAHMDTVHKEQCTEIKEENGKLSSPQGIGGDDRCGIFIIMNLVKEFHCSVLLCEDEEIGGVGAHKFVKTKYINSLDVNYMVEFDRKGNNDAVFYSCDNKDFTDFVTDFTGFKFAYGSYSDISTLMPAAKLAAVNLSSGYYNAHTTNEYVVYEEMMDTIEAARALIKADCEEPFKYVAKTYDYGNWYKNNNKTNTQKAIVEPEYAYDLFDIARYHDERLYKIAKDDKQVEMEVVTMDLEGREEVLYARGDTKAECWMNLFLEYPDLCFNDIADYNWF